MPSINPTEQQINELAGADDPGPVVMVNLLRFKGDTGNGNDGAAAYGRYGRSVLPMLAKIGARVLWLGAVEQVFIGGDDDRWDQVLVVEYPSRKAFLGMIASDEYRAAHRDREIALDDSALIACRTIMKKQGEGRGARG
jgi:uncharacterized protein (DUF1330 family)